MPHVYAGRRSLRLRSCRPLAGTLVTHPGIMRLPASGRHYPSDSSNVSAGPRPAASFHWGEQQVLEIETEIGQV